MVNLFCFQIDLTSHHVSTLVGTGKQGNDNTGGQCGTEQEISSPWDLTIGDDLGMLLLGLYFFFTNIQIKIKMRSLQVYGKNFNVKVNSGAFSDLSCLKFLFLSNTPGDSLPMLCMIHTFAVIDN